MSWFKPKYHTKPGFLSSKTEHDLTPATLRLYPNGLRIVIWDLTDRLYLVEQIDAQSYKILTDDVWHFEKFLVAE